jgi:alpha-mannosidase
VKVRFAGPIASAREVNAQEQPLGPATVVNGTLESSFGPYEPRTFALILGAPPARVASVESEPLTLKYNLAVASNNDTETVGGFDGKGDALPAEMLPSNLKFNDVTFRLAPSGTGQPDALVAQGQTIKLPPGNFNKVYLLVASANGDQKTEFRVGTQSAVLTIQDWGGFIGQWDTRLWNPAPDTVTVDNDPTHKIPLRKDWAVSANHATWTDMTYRGSPNWSPRYPEDYRGLIPGYIKRADLAWYADHYHTPQGLNEPYAYSYLFGYSIKMPPHATTLTLPKNDNIRILAVSLAREEPDAIPVQPLYDTLDWQAENRQEYSASEH